jgi:N-acetylmuramoyl-L-alanine amidase
MADHHDSFFGSRSLSDKSNDGDGRRKPISAPARSGAGNIDVLQNVKARRLNRRKRICPSVDSRWLAVGSGAYVIQPAIASFHCADARWQLRRVGNRAVTPTDIDLTPELSAPLTILGPSTAQRYPLAIKRIVIDPGHGGEPRRNVRVRRRGKGNYLGRGAAVAPLDGP